MNKERTMVVRFIEQMKHRGFVIKPITEVTDAEVFDFRMRMKQLR